MIIIFIVAQNVLLSLQIIKGRDVKRLPTTSIINFSLELRAKLDPHPLPSGEVRSTTVEVAQMLCEVFFCEVIVLLHQRLSSIKGLSTECHLHQKLSYLEDYLPFKVVFH